MTLILVLGPVLLPEYRDPNAGRPDLLSAALSVVAVLAVIFALKSVAAYGPSVPALGALTIGVAAAVAFVKRQQHLDDPLVDLRVFRAAGFSGMLATYALSILAAFGAFLYVPQYLQLVRGQSPLEAGLWTLGWPLAFVVGSMVTPRLAQRIRPGMLMAGGLVLAGLGNLVLAKLDAGANLWILVFGTVIVGLGLSPMFTLATEAIVGSAPPERAGAASAIAETCSELAVALGIAVLGSVGTLVYRTQLAATLPQRLPADVAAAATETLGGALVVAEHLPIELRAALTEAAGAAFVHGLQLSAMTSAIVALALALIAAVVLRGLGHDQPSVETSDTSATAEPAAKYLGSVA
jgi:DHA2 family multidrug resistance protein-like MFS transporter